MTPLCILYAALLGALIALCIIRIAHACAPRPAPWRLWLTDYAGAALAGAVIYGAFAAVAWGVWWLGWGRW